VYKTVLPIVLYECEICKEHRLMVVENSVLKRVFGCKRGKVTGGSRKLSGASPNIVRMIKSCRMRLVEHITCMGIIIDLNAYETLVIKPEGKRPLGRHECKGECMLKWVLME
jgi:hypothetical protein